MMNRGRLRTPNPELRRASTILFESVADLRSLDAAVRAGDPTATTYGIYGTPTTLALTELLLAREGGSGVVYAPSGLAAIAVALLGVTRAGSHLLAPDSSYQPLRELSGGLLARFGVETEFYDPLIGGEIAGLIRPTTDAIWMESPGSHTFEIQDVPAIVRAARAASDARSDGTRIATLIDNTYGSPGLFAPLAHGVDASIIALTKYWGGHSDILLGAVVTNDAVLVPIRDAARALGVCTNADEAWLAVRGARTVDVRLRAHEAAALEIARRLAAHPRVGRVLHPALPDCPGHEIWQRDFNGSNGLFSFELLRADGTPADRKDAEAFTDRLAARGHFGIGWSWGGFESLAVPVGIVRTIRPWTGGALVRLHVGLEPVDQLWADLAATLAE